MKQRYLELDAIRGIAALMVVLYHYTVRYGQIYAFPVDPPFTFVFGQYGVQLFFMVSGFVIFLTLNNTVHAMDFIVSRFSRLYPAYWVAVILTFAAVHVFGLPGREVDLKSAVVNLSMLQMWLGVSDVDGVYWTLAVELSFYLIMYVLYLAGQLGRITLISCVWLGLIVLAHYLESHQYLQIDWRLKLMLLLQYGNLFIAGILFYRIMQFNRAADYLVLLAALLVEYYLHGKLVLLVAAYFGIFMLFVKGYLAKLALRPLIFLGSISYCLYLVHQNIGYIVIRNLEAGGLANRFTVVAVPAAVSIALATVMHVTAEKPALREIRRLWKGSNLRRQLTAAYSRA